MATLGEKGLLQRAFYCFWYGSSSPKKIMPNIVKLPAADRRILLFGRQPLGDSRHLAACSSQLAPFFPTFAAYHFFIYAPTRRH